MNVQEKISKYRVIPCIIMLIYAMSITGILGVLNKIDFDDLFCAFMVVLCLVLVLIFELAYERPRSMIGNNPQTNYKRFTIGFVLCGLLTVAMAFYPSFFRPVMLIPLIMIAFSNEFVGLFVGQVWVCVLVLTVGKGFYELVGSVLLVMIAGTLSKALRQQGLRIYLGILLGICSLLFPILMYYLSYDRISATEIGYGMISGILTSLYAIVGFSKNHVKTQEDIAYHYDEILSEEYVQVREIKNYSAAEYRHARKVSDICYKYARTLGLKADLAASAGLYYRLGRLDGEPVVENGVKRAKELCFSEELITIISEYNGEVNLPSTPESALVHIVDALLIKLELLEKDLGTSQWNREVLIYQTLNEFSGAGMYDKSGLSINAFLKIREMLAKEELLS